MEITIDREAHDLVSAWVKAASPSEIGGIGYVTLVEKGHFHISEFVLLEQEASSGSVDFEGEAYVEEIMRAANDNKENELRLSWHSHGDMNVFWSGTDEKGITEYQSLQMPWLVSVVFNDDGDALGRLDIFDNECLSQIKFDDVPVKVDVNPELLEQAEKDVKKFVTAKKQKWATSYSGYQSSNKKKDDDDDETGDNPNKGVNRLDSQAWSDDDENDSDIDEMPDWLEKEDFMDSTSYAIMEMQFGTKNVEAWEEQLWGDSGFIIVDSEAEEDEEETRILTP